MCSRWCRHEYASVWHHLDRTTVPASQRPKVRQGSSRSFVSHHSHHPQSYSSDLLHPHPLPSVPCLAVSPPSPRPPSVPHALCATGSAQDTCSSSHSTPALSLGSRNSTGLLWAPILGLPSPSTRTPPALTYWLAAAMLSTWG